MFGPLVTDCKKWWGMFLPKAFSICKYMRHHSERGKLVSGPGHNTVKYGAVTLRWFLISVNGFISLVSLHLKKFTMEIPIGDHVIYNNDKIQIIITHSPSPIPITHIQVSVCHSKFSSPFAAKVIPPSSYLQLWLPTAMPVLHKPHVSSGRPGWWRNNSFTGYHWGRTF